MEFVILTFYQILKDHSNLTIFDLEDEVDDALDVVVLKMFLGVSKKV